MSSICGVYFRDNRPVEAHQLGAMVDVLSHWGPDGTGVWRDGKIGLGHLSLWTTPEAVSESCPFVFARAGVTVTADARIDNREDLIESLHLKEEVALRTLGDVELIARAYEKWGENCVTHIVGDFAFAVWDDRNQRLFCARDPMGIRPFYYYLDDRRFIFGTEIKAIFTHPEISRELNSLRLALFIIGGHLEGELTQFQSILTLEPANALIVDARGLRKYRYWNLDLEHEIRFSREDDYVDAFEEIFQRSVDARLRSTTRVGSMLSGGLDATTMLSFASRSRSFRARDLSAYTWAMREGDTWHEPDEREYVDAYLRDHPIEHSYVIPDSTQIFADRARIRHLNDGPNWDIFSFAMEPMFAAATASDTRVLLFGNGGDETASYFVHDYLNTLFFTGKWSTLQREIKAEAARRSLTIGRYAKSYFLRPLIKQGQWRGPFQYQFVHDFFIRKTDPSVTFASPLAKGLAKSLQLVDYLESRRPNLPGGWRRPARASQIAGLTGSNLFANWSALKWNSSVLHRMEGRYPFLDQRVIEYCVALPAEQHRKGGVARRLLRRTAARRIPREIAQRRDKTLTIPDMIRGIVHREDDLRVQFGQWSRNSEAANLINFDQLDSILDELVSSSRPDGSHTPIDSGAFCRSILLASYFGIDSLGNST